MELIACSSNLKILLVKDSPLTYFKGPNYGYDYPPKYFIFENKASLMTLGFICVLLKFLYTLYSCIY